jgi:hypothetical protein
MALWPLLASDSSTGVISFSPSILSDNHESNLHCVYEKRVGHDGSSPEWFEIQHRKAMDEVPELA